MFLTSIVAAATIAIAGQPINIESLVAQVFLHTCDRPLIEASLDPKEADRYIKSLEKRSQRVFQSLDVGLVMIVPRRDMTYTLWIERDSLGIRHITEAWYYKDTNQLDDRYSQMLGQMLDNRGEPQEDAWDYAMWDPQQNCGQAMIVLVQEKKEQFITRRVWFR